MGECGVCQAELPDEDCNEEGLGYDGCEEPCDSGYEVR